MAANKEEDFCFTIPDWKNEEAYSHLGKDTSIEEWSWEFRRRSKYYWDDSYRSYEHHKYLLDFKITDELIDIASREVEKNHGENALGAILVRNLNDEDIQLDKMPEFTKALKASQPPINTKNLSVCRILISKQQIEQFKADWCVEEKQSKPGYSKIIPNPNSPFSEVILSFPLTSESQVQVPEPKIVKEIPKKEDSKLKPESIYIEVCPFGNPVKNSETIKKLLKVEHKKRLEIKGVQDLLGPKRKQKYKLYIKYLRVLDGIRKKAGYAQIGGLLFSKEEFANEEGYKDTNTIKIGRKQKASDYFDAAKKLVKETINRNPSETYRILSYMNHQGEDW